MRGARSAVLTVALAVLAGGLTACGSAGSGSDGGPSAAATASGGTVASPAVTSGAVAAGKAAATDPKAALAASAEVMRKAGSARYALSVPEGLEAEPGTGFANWATGPAAIEYLTDTPNAPIRVRVVGNEAYMGPTEQAAAGAGEQVFWVKTPFLMWRRPFYPQLAMAMDPVNQLTLATTGGSARSEPSRSTVPKSRTTAPSPTSPPWWARYPTSPRNTARTSKPPSRRAAKRTPSTSGSTPSRNSAGSASSAPTTARPEPSP